MNTIIKAEKVILKYALRITKSQVVQMPKGAEILTVQVQRGVVCLWVLADVDAPKQPRTFEVLGTGISIEDGRRRYIGTVQTHEGEYVWHVFERFN